MPSLVDQQGTAVRRPNEHGALCCRRDLRSEIRDDSTHIRDARPLIGPPRRWSFLLLGPARLGRGFLRLPDSFAIPPPWECSAQAGSGGHPSRWPTLACAPPDSTRTAPCTTPGG